VGGTNSEGIVNRARLGLAVNFNVSVYESLAEEEEMMKGITVVSAVFMNRPILKRCHKT
jgi:hypothetical protein